MTRTTIKTNLESAYKLLNTITVKGADNCRAIANIATALDNVYQLTQSKEVEYADEKTPEKGEEETK
jgi:hypothetical protein